jgi:hypothetical protein
MSGTPRLIQQEFEGWIKAVKLSGASPEQLREMRRAFFAGARAYSNLVIINAEDGDDVTENDLALMEGLELEMSRFCDDVLAGSA